MADGGSPLVYRRRLRAELRQARQATDPTLTQEQVADEMDWSLSKVIRIESASSGISANDLKALLQLYGVKDPEKVDSLLALARAARGPSWWSKYRDVAPPSLLQLIEYESAAQAIRQFENLLIPGILQTKDYARSVIQSYYGEGPGSEQRRALVELRTQREKLFDGDNAPSFHFILDEAVIRRPVGGASVMNRQLRRLLEVADRPNITVEVVPFSVGLHPGMSGPFKVIEFADALDKDIAFLESPRDDIISDIPEETLGYRNKFDTLSEVSLRPRDSLTYIAKIADEMRN
jgi:transcriptional regulator with XRE-family HTH domain